MSGRFSYQKLKNEAVIDDEDYKVVGRSRLKSRKASFKKRFKLRIPSLRRLLRRKKGKLVSAWQKVIKRFKESQAHFGDLFAGNYMFYQVNPTQFKSNPPTYYLPKVVSSTY